MQATVRSPWVFLFRIIGMLCLSSVVSLVWLLYSTPTQPVLERGSKHFIMRTF